MNNNLKELCKRAGIKQEFLAKQTGVSQGVISSWMNNKFYPNTENLIQLSEVLGVTVGCVLGREPIPEGYPDAYTQPVFYNEVLEAQRKAEEEKRLLKAQKKKPPFTTAQLEYLEEREDRLVEKIADALREDISSLREPK